MDQEELKRLTKEEISRRIREGVKAVIEQVLEEEMTEHLAAGYRERTPSRRGERNGYYTRDLITPAGRIAQLRVPRDREGTFLTEVFERYKRMTRGGGGSGAGDVPARGLHPQGSGHHGRPVPGAHR
jgi:putative transposase